MRIALGKWPLVERRKSHSLHRRTTRRLWFWHLAAVIALIVLILAAHGLTRQKILLGAQDAEIINIAGRQRMLSQRILYFGEKHFQFGDAVSTGVFNEALDLFEESHAWLLANAVKDGPNAAHYFASDRTNLDERTKTFIAHARSLLEHAPYSPAARTLVNKMAQDAETSLLTSLNQAVSLYEADTEKHIQDLLRQQTAITAFIVLLLIAEVLFIFRPLVRTVLASLKRLDLAANADGLTGLANHKRLWELLDKRLVARPSTQEDLVVINVDLDGFKAVNDTLGHPAGDAVLVHVARLLETKAASLEGVHDPVVARLGGDEFVVAFGVAPDQSNCMAEILGELFLQAVSAPFSLELGEASERCMIGMSLGYTSASESGDNLAVLVANADIALYESKRAGKGRVTRFLPHMRDTAERRHRLETDLREAVLNGEFVPVYQPQVSLSSAAVTGVEVALRWVHPERGELAPGAFFTAASDLGVMEMIEGTVILRALEDMAALREAGYTVPHIAFNMTLPFLTADGFCQNLKTLCEMNGFRTSELVLEVSDADLSQATDPEVFRALEDLNRAGFRINIDGFGVGGSTLPMLTALDLAGIKLARDLVSRLGDPRTERVIAASVAVAKEIGLEVAAVGVDTSDHVARMRALGCTAAQGHAIAAPGSIEALKAFLAVNLRPEVVRLRTK
jgi:diguanylate cyclase (GGDEF)-like protein